MRFQTLADIPRVHAAEDGDRIALQFEQRRTTYAQWDRRCSQVACALLALGLPAGSRIGYLGKNSDQFFHVLFGAVKAGMVTVPVNWRLAQPEVTAILDDAQCALLFLGAEYVGMTGAFRTSCPRIHNVVGVDGPADGATAWDDWLADASTTDPRISCRADDTALQLYTSGTTGVPKGAQLTHGNLLFAASLSALPMLGTWSSDDVSVLPLPIFHAGGIVYGLNGPYAGCTTVVVKEANPALILAALRDAPSPATRLGVVPAVLQMLLDHPECAVANFSSLRTMTYGGSPITPALLRRAVDRIGPVLIQLFGMTETATIGTALLRQDHDPANPARLTSCGRPLPGVDVAVINLQGERAAAGQSGEIVIRCKAVMKGYWNQPVATAGALRDGWYHSGDIGYVDGNGYLYIQDRMKDMVITGGENVYPAEVERVLAEHPGVADIAVIGVPDPNWGEAVKAIVVVRPGAAVEQQALIDFARERLAGYKCPKSIDFVQQIPRNASGKILKRVLREPFWEGRSRGVN